MQKLMIAAACAALSVPATPAFECPDVGTRHVAPKAESYFVQTCGGGISGSYGGIRIETPTNECPQFVIITPGYDEPAPRKGYRAVAQSTHPILIEYFACQTSWMLGFIPIVVSSQCARTGSKNGGAVTHYVQVPCDVEVEAVDASIGSTAEVLR